MRILINTILIMGFVMSALIAQAHHSFSATFFDDVITVEGVVDRLSFTNPHVIIYFNVTDENGQQQEWMSEGGAATLKRREGWDRDALVKGDYIQITGNSTRNGSPMVSMGTVNFIDPDTGSVLGSPGTGERAPYVHGTTPMQLADGRPNLTGVWASTRRRAAGGGGVPARAPVPFNEVGAALQAQYDPLNDPQVQCEPPGLIRQVGTPHPVQVEQFDDHVVISYEEYGGVRTIYFDDRDLVGGEHSNFGQSTARYEDQKLIVETTHLLGNLTSGGGNALTDQSTTVEAYSRLPDADGSSGLNLEIVITDPGHLTEPWVRGWQKFFTPNHEFIEVDCHKPLAY